MPDPSPTAQIIGDHDRTRENLINALAAVDEGDTPEAVLTIDELATTLGDAARYWKHTAESIEKILDSNNETAQAVINAVSSTLTEVGSTTDNNDDTDDALITRVNALCALTRRYYRISDQATRDRDAIALRYAARTRTLPLTAGTYRHDDSEYAIIVDQAGRTLTIDATGASGHIELHGETVLHDAAALRAAAEAMLAIANHIDERPTA